jgi:hypothetical protein
MMSELSLGNMRVVDDLTLYEDPGFNKKKYFLLSDEREIYLKLDEQQYLYFKVLIPYLNGLTNKEQIEEELRNQLGQSIDISKGIEFLYQKGLFYGTEKKTVSKVELELSGKKLFEAPMAAIQEKYGLLLRRTLVFIMILSWISIVVGMFLIIRDPQIVVETYRESKSFRWNEVALWEYVVVGIGIFLSVFIHELGHILTANYFGIKLKSFNFLIHMGISPVFYIKYKNLYATTSKKKVLILMAGVYFNLIQASIFWLLLSLTSDWKFAVLMIMNLGAIISNLSLLGVSDGYHVAAILFGVEGLRWNMLKQMSRIIQLKGQGRPVMSKKGWLMIGYFLLSYGMTFAGIYYWIKLVVDFLGLHILNSNVISILAVAAMLMSVGYFVIKFFKSLRNMNLS